MPYLRLFSFLLFLVADLIVFKGEGTKAYHDNELDKADSAGSHLFNSTPSGGARYQNKGRKIHSRVSFSPANGKQKGE